MKFMATWTIAPENQKAVIKRFKEGTDPMDGIKQLGRWHELATGRGFRLIETDDPVAITKNVLYWNDLIDMRIVPVLDDEEITIALGG